MLDILIFFVVTKLNCICCCFLYIRLLGLAARMTLRSTRAQRVYLVAYCNCASTVAVAALVGSIGLFIDTENSASLMVPLS